MHHEEDGALRFFKAQHHAFCETLSKWKESPVSALLSQAFSSFDGNLEVQAQGMPEVACHKGCATCCTIRVVATAPEILLAARYIEALARKGMDLSGRIADADSATRNLGDAGRVALRRRCPFIFEGACIIYPVRPLACRGHASYDKKACAEAAAGRLESIPFSMPHMMVRSLIQNALQAALRDFGLAWTVYEFNHALTLALSGTDCETSWMKGIDVFSEAAVDDVAQEEMAAAFDRIKSAS